MATHDQRDYDREPTIGTTIIASSPAQKDFIRNQLFTWLGQVARHILPDPDNPDDSIVRRGGNLTGQTFGHCAETQALVIQFL